MNYTPNLNLNLPEVADQFNLEHWNQNTEKIDIALQAEIDARTSAMSNFNNRLDSEQTARQTGVADAKNLANATGVLSAEHGGTGNNTLKGSLNALTSNTSNTTDVKKTDSFIFKRSEDGSNETKDASLNSMADAIYSLIKNRINTTVPRGVIYPFSGEFGTEADPYANVPNGYLACDGQEVSRTTYAELFALIGTKYGNGDEINTFNVPDCREVTLVGAGQSARTDIVAHDIYTVGQFKDDQLQSHVHSLRQWPFLPSGYGYIDGQGTNASQINSQFNTSDPNTDGFGGSEIARCGTTTHGKQMGMNYIIKY